MGRAEGLRTCASSKKDICTTKFLELLLRFGYVNHPEGEKALTLNLPEETKTQFLKECSEFLRHIDETEASKLIVYLRKLYFQEVSRLESSPKNTNESKFSWFSLAKQLFSRASISVTGKTSPPRSLENATTSPTKKFRTESPVIEDATISELNALYEKTNKKLIYRRARSRSLRDSSMKINTVDKVKLRSKSVSPFSKFKVSTPILCLVPPIVNPPESIHSATSIDDDPGFPKLNFWESAINYFLSATTSTFTTPIVTNSNLSPSPETKPSPSPETKPSPSPETKPSPSPETKPSISPNNRASTSLVAKTFSTPPNKVNKSYKAKFSTSLASQNSKEFSPVTRLSHSFPGSVFISPTKGSSTSSITKALSFSSDTEESNFFAPGHATTTSRTLTDDQASASNKPSVIRYTGNSILSNKTTISFPPATVISDNSSTAGGSNCLTGNELTSLSNRASPLLAESDPNSISGSDPTLLAYRNPASSTESDRPSTADIALTSHSPLALVSPASGALPDQLTTSSAKIAPSSSTSSTNLTTLEYSTPIQFDSEVSTSTPLDSSSSASTVCTSTVSPSTITSLPVSDESSAYSFWPFSLPNFDVSSAFSFWPFTSPASSILPGNESSAMDCGDAATSHLLVTSTETIDDVTFIRVDFRDSNSPVNNDRMS